jgi:hypothetical protein
MPNIIFFLLFLVGWDWVSWYCGHYRPIVPAPGDRWWWLWRNRWNEDWRGKPKYSDKTLLPQRHFVHHKSHMTRPGFEPGMPYMVEEQRWGVEYQTISLLMNDMFASAVVGPRSALNKRVSHGVCLYVWGFTSVWLRQTTHANVPLETSANFGGCGVFPGSKNWHVLRHVITQSEHYFKFNVS